MLRLAAAEFRRPEPALDPAVIDLLLAHNWPGNVRELYNEMSRAVVCARDGVVRTGDLSPALTHAPSPRTPIASLGVSLRARSLPEMVEQLERERIHEALAACGYNQVKTARRLGLSRQGLINKLKRYDLLSSTRSR
jgi:DNA-binding NtrC family response regulator